MFQIKGIGDLTVAEDQDVVGGFRITMTTDNGEKLCSHMICRNYMETLTRYDPLYKETHFGLLCIHKAIVKHLGQTIQYYFWHF